MYSTTACVGPTTGYVCRGGVGRGANTCQGRHDRGWAQLTTTGPDWINVGVTEDRGSVVGSSNNFQPDGILLIWLAVMVHMASCSCSNA